MSQTWKLESGSGDRLRLRPIAGVIGAEVLSPPLHAVSAADVAELKLGMAHHGVLFFRTGDRSVSEHVRFSRLLGELVAPSELISTLAAEGFPDVGVVSTANGFAFYSDHWHSDVSWQAAPTKYSVLHMQDCPSFGGDTMWASQVAAYDGLSERMKEYLHGLTAHHSPPGATALGAEHPVVCVHPLTGRRALYVNEFFVSRINELSEDESGAVLRFLYKHSTRPEFVCRWRWEPGDIAVWDNQFVQHYAVGDYHPAPRRIHRVEVCGDVPQAVAS